MNKLTVCISGLIYPVTMMRFFWEALEKRDDCKVFSIGPFFGNFIPWPNDQGTPGRFLPDKYTKVPDAPLPKQAATTYLDPQMIVDIVPKDIDLFLQVDAGWHFSARPPGKVVALVETDAHCPGWQQGHYKLPRSYSDYVFTMHSNFMNPGEFFLPYAAHDWVYPPQFDVEKEFDVAMIGVQYGNRVDLARMLRAEGCSVRNDTGIIFDEYREVYHKSRCALSLSSAKDTPVRVWEAFAMAVPLVADRTPDLERFFIEDVHYKGFDTLGEAVNQIRWVLQYPDEAQAMANNAYRVLIKNDHTFDNRVKTILEICGLIE